MGKNNDVDKLLNCLNEFKKSVSKLPNDNLTFEQITKQFESSFKEYIHSRSKILFRTNRVLSQIYDKLKKYNNETMDMKKINGYMDLLKIQGKTSIKSGAAIDNKNFLIEYYSNLSEIQQKLTLHLSEIQNKKSSDMKNKTRSNVVQLDDEGKKLIGQINLLTQTAKRRREFRCEKFYSYILTGFSNKVEKNLADPILKAAKKFGYNSKTNDYDFICSQEQLNEEMKKLNLKYSDLPTVYNTKEFQNAYEELKKEFKEMYLRGINNFEKCNQINIKANDRTIIYGDSVCGCLLWRDINPYLALGNAEECTIENNCKYTIASNFSYPFTFLKSSKLKVIKFSGGILKKIENGAFKGLNALEEVTFGKISVNINEENLKKIFCGKKVNILDDERNDIFLNSIKNFISKMNSIEHFDEIPKELSKCLERTEEKLKKPILDEINSIFGDSQKFYGIESFEQISQKSEIKNRDDLPPIYNEKKFEEIYNKLKSTINSKVKQLIRKFEHSISWQEISIKSNIIDNKIINHIQSYVNYPKENVYKNIKIICIDIEKENYTIKKNFNELSNSLTNLQEIRFNKTLNKIEKSAFENFKNLKKLTFYKVSSNAKKNLSKLNNNITISIINNDSDQQEILKCISKLIADISEIKIWSDYECFFDEKNIIKYFTNIKGNTKTNILNELKKFGAMRFIDKDGLKKEIKEIFISKFEKKIMEKYKELISAIHDKGDNLIETINNNLKNNYQDIKIDDDIVNMTNVIKAINSLDNNRFIKNATKINIILKKAYTIKSDFNFLKSSYFQNLQEIKFNQTLNIIEKDAFKDFKDLKKVTFEKIADNIKQEDLNSYFPQQCEIVINKNSTNKKSKFNFFKKRNRLYG